MSPLSFSLPLVTKVSIVRLCQHPDGFWILVFNFVDKKTLIYLRLPKFFFLSKNIDKNTITISIMESSSLKKPLQLRQTTKALVSKLFNYVSQFFFPYTQSLKLKGMGYKWYKLLNYLVLKIRYSHLCYLQFTPWVSPYILDKYTLLLSSGSKKIINQTACNLKNVFRADAYKGKGLRFWNQNFRLKVGKQTQM